MQNNSALKKLEVGLERQMWPYHEENGRSSTEYDAKKAGTDAADQRRNDKCWPERNERNANNIRIDRKPQHGRNPNRRQSKGIASDSPRPERGDINVKVRQHPLSLWEYAPTTESALQL
jgi:hypothetical protein